MDDWYFAYGSNLWIDQMVRRTGLKISIADRPRLVRLLGYRLAFNMRGERGEVFANIVRPGAEVRGVIYRCGPDTLKRLDEYESGYERQQLTVLDDLGERFEAAVYVAKPEFVADGRPSAEYIQRILLGARQHGLPEDYIQIIMQLATPPRFGRS